MLNSNNKTIQILFRILLKINTYNFNAAVGKSNDQSALKREIVVHVIDNIREIAKQAGNELCRHNNETYVFVGTHWVQLEDTTLSSFLGEGAKRMGVDTTESRHYEFRESLMKQFRVVASGINVYAKKSAVKINLLNGTLWISKNGFMLKGFNPNDFMTYQLPFNHDENANAPKFQKFLDRVLPDKTLQMVMAEYIGYIFIPNSVMKLEKGLILAGEGANGKSTFFDIINALFGRENVTTFPMSRLTDENGYYRARIANKLLNYASEISPNMDTTRFKQLISGEAVDARLPFKEPFILEDYARMIFNTNELPKDVEHNHAFFRRFLIVPFNVRIPESEQDKDLANKIIKDELAGVLNWALSGLNRLLKQGGFTKSEVLDDIVSRYKKDSDSVFTFLEDNNYKPSINNELLMKEMFSSYKSYCLDNLYRAVGNKTFRKRLEHHGYMCKKTNVGIKVGAIVSQVTNDRSTYGYIQN